MSVLRIARSIRTIKDEELAELEQMAKGQLAYCSPLKMATMGRQHALGMHNLLVLAKLRELRDAIKAGEQLRKRRDD
jgi:hypothetical protein